ncbi:hypothetical protein [Streptomyces spectabilis]|uniref:Uncharacterized protein n=1 Tax=Streptomyces spectabilis TaxID=68270 RepID=A0A516R9Y4_STRST|nr:hypothetical protein [Streptomyces spectabilis]QDQ12465.1 hypothetical protein FH965_19460 [Streptomyces spectabilis]
MHLDRLARRVDQLGPVALVDPLTRNLLAADQAAGVGDPGKWLTAGSEIILYGGAFGDYIANTVSVETVGAEGYTNLTWKHPYFPGFPVMPGQTYTWWTPDLVSAGAAMMTARVAWYDVANTYLSTSSASTAGVPLVATVPAKAAYLRPYVAFTAKGMWLMGSSVLALGDISAALTAGERPTGEGAPAYSITKYSHAASDGDGAFRDIGLELVEVTAP